MRVRLNYYNHSVIFTYKSNQSPIQLVTRCGMYANAIQLLGTSSKLIPELVLNINAWEHAQESIPVGECGGYFPPQAIGQLFHTTSNIRE